MTKMLKSTSTAFLRLDLAGFVRDYDDVSILPEAAAALKQGNNVLSLHCHQTGGGQFMDVGIAAALARRRATK